MTARTSMLRLLGRLLPPALVRGVQRWMAADLWLALGRDSGFERQCEADGWAETWARMLHDVRRLRDEYRWEDQ